MIGTSDLLSLRAEGALRVRLDALRHVGDPLLDGLDTDTLNALAATLRDGALLQGPLEQVRLPRSADPARLARAGRFFLRHAAPLSFLLGTTSLLECFACGAGARALHGARTMRRAPTRRVGETGQFVLALYAPGAWTPDGAAVRTLLRVRVLHAQIRRTIDKAGGRTLPSAPSRENQTSVDEVPLNQEDQLGTLLAFALSPLLHLRSLGVRVAREDVEDSLHLWRTAGAILGVAVEHLPPDEPGAVALATCIRYRHFEASREGRELTSALLGAYSGVMKSERLDRMFLALLRELAGEGVCDALAVPPGDPPVVGRALTRALASSTRAWARLAEIPGLSLPVEALVPAALGAHARRMAGGRARYETPASA